MSEAGPSSVSTPTSSFASTSAGTTTSRHSRFQFPLNGEQDAAARTRSIRPDGSTRIMSFGQSGSFPSRRAGVANGGTGSSSSQAVEGVRRRVKSVDAVESPLMGVSRLSRPHEQDVEAHKRTMSTTKRPVGKGKALVTSVDMPAEVPSVTFSDEYDLSHEDPRILEDVQRALKLKVRRETRFKTNLATAPVKEAVVTSDQASGSSMSAYSSPIRTKYPEAPPPIVAPVSTHNVESEIDFSPSVGAVPLHPVPSSSNGGATLDWTGSGSEDERDKRWSLYITKRRHKDKTAYHASRSIVEKQESLYVDKLARIKAKAKPHTLRKAAITAEQLQRRYAVLLAPTKPIKPPVTLLGSARWYNEQESVVQTLLDSAEPLTWLKHLLEKRGKRDVRPPWHLSAMIIEEYAKTFSRPEPMQTIPEDSALSDTTPAPDSNPLVPLSPKPRSPSKTPSSGSWSWTPPPRSLEPSLSRKRRSTGDTDDDGLISFEPLVDSGRESAGPDSRRSSIDLLNKGQRTVYSTDSTRSSTYSNMFSATRGLGMSPTGTGTNSSRMQFREFAKRMRRRPGNGNLSEDGLSSSRNSVSEFSHDHEHDHDEDLRRASSPTKQKARSRPVSLQFKSPKSPFDGGVLSEGDRGALSDRLSSGGEGPMTARQGMSPYITPATPPVATAKELTVPASSRGQSPAPAPAKKRRRNTSARRRRMSLSSLDQILSKEQQKQQAQVDEDLERQEYDQKTQLLEDTLAQNHRTRQLLQRVGANIREYENVQSRLAQLTGRGHISIPQEVLEAFSHDPASVTGATRRFKSWRAVEDIQQRIIRQQDTLQLFVASLNQQDADTNEECVFDEPIATLSDSLEQLEQRRQDIARKAEEVAEALVRAKDIHANVKGEYNDVLGHTSLIYPELSQIVALEESYRNKYQQFWDLALDALTLLLDTVTPVWRNYGKVIGEDVQDFLIIPWYRNQFTGEPERYEITRLPRRSFRHWLGLLVFGATTIAVALLQLRAAVSSTMNCNLPWITHMGFRCVVLPFFMVGLVIQWCAVLFECLILFAETGVVLWWLGWAVRVFH